MLQMGGRDCGSGVQVHDPDRPPIPTTLYASINGVIGVIATLPGQQFQWFAKLQVGARAPFQAARLIPAWHAPQASQAQPSGRPDCRLRSALV